MSWYYEVKFWLLQTEYADGKSTTVRIPCCNNSNNLRHLFEIINEYFERVGEEVFEKRKQAVFQTDSPISSDDKNQKTDKNAEEYSESNLEKEEEDNKAFYQEESYVIGQYSRPADGEHKQVNPLNETLRVGYWKDGELFRGTEYNWLVKVLQGALIYKPECPEDPYDATDDFDYEKVELYGMEFLSPLSMAEVYIEHEGLETYYIADMEVDGDMEQMVHIRPLKSFLEANNPELLKRLEKNIAMYKEE